MYGFQSGDVITFDHKDGRRRVGVVVSHKNVFTMIQGVLSGQGMKILKIPKNATSVATTPFEEGRCGIEYNQWLILKAVRKAVRMSARV